MHLASLARILANRVRKHTGDQLPSPILESMGGRIFVTPRQTCPQPESLGRNLRSNTRWFTGFCNSHQVSHFATFFIDARAEISIAESPMRTIQPKLKSWAWITTESAGTVRNRPTESDVSSFSSHSVSRVPQ
ncbi:hypothetical protein YC2023_072224 [Brassica napus]